MRIGIFGGVFNPIHFGHLRAAEEVRTALEMDRVMFITAARPPHKSSEVADASDRLKMVQSAIRDNPNFVASSLELNRPDASFSVHTIEELKSKYPAAEFCFVMGIDAFLDFGTWLQPEKILSLSDIAIISRPPFGFDRIADSPFITPVTREELESLRQGKTRILEKMSTAGQRVCSQQQRARSQRQRVCSQQRKIYLTNITPLDISSTSIRRLVRNGESIKYLLPAAVESYILSSKLYRRAMSHNGG